MLSYDEKNYVNQCLDTGWISSRGEFVEKFENEFGRYTGIENVTSVSNGTVALHLALLGLGIGEGDEVIVPTFTYVASVNAIRYVGAVPVFVDCELSNWQMSVDEIAKCITSKTKAIMVVHIYGQPCEMDSICNIAKYNKLFIIEDCAEAFGTTYRNSHVGSFGDVGTFSFFGNKTITTGEGGMVVTKDSSVLRKIIKLKGQGLAENREYWHDVIGYNYRMTNICAAIGLGQLEKANNILELKKNIHEFYAEKFNGIPLKMQAEVPNGKSSYWMCSILLEDRKKRDEIRVFLKNNGVETRPLFPPVSSMPMYNSNSKNYKNANSISARGMNLPSWPGLTLNDLKLITDCVVKCL